MVVDEMVNYFLPSVTNTPDWLTNSMEAAAAASSRHGVQALSLVMILISCTGIFLPLEVALNQAWGVTKSRNYLYNQTIAFGLALLMVGLGVGSMVVNVNVDKVLAVALVHDPNNWIFQVLNYSLRRSELCLAGALNGRGVDCLFLFGLLPAAQSQGAVASGIAHVDCYRDGLADLAVYLCRRAAASRPEGALWAVLCFGGLLFWAYISGLILFAGAQFSVARWGNRRGNRQQGIGNRKITSSLSRFPASVFALCSLTDRGNLEKQA